MNSLKRFVSRGLRLLTVLAVLLLLAGGLQPAAWAKDTESSIFGCYDPDAAEQASGNMLQNVGPESTFEPQDACYGDTLKHSSGDPNQYAWNTYQVIKTETEAGRYSFSVNTLYGLSKTDIQTYLLAAFAAWTIDYPLESCDCTGSFTYCRNGNLAVTIATEGDVLKDRAKLQKAVDNFQMAYNEKLPELATQTEKYRFVHDYLCKRLHYNYSAYKDQAAYSQMPRKHVYDAYGALVGLENDGDAGDVVCNGYADAYLLLCRAVRLPCICVGGLTNQQSADSRHIWNYIFLDNAWYGVDVTWDDDDYTYDSTSSEWYNGVGVSYYDYPYFGNNDKFTGTGANHFADPTMGYSWNDSTPIWQFEAPALSENATVNTDGWHADEMTVRCAGNFTAGTNIAQTQQDIPVVNIELTQNATASQAAYVAGGQTYHVRGNAYSVSCGAGFTDHLFLVSAGGSLKLENLTITGSKDSTLPLIDCSADGAELSLQNTAVADCKQAYAIDSNGEIVLTGKVIVSGNEQNGEAADILMHDGCLVRLPESLAAGSSIGLKKESPGVCVSKNNDAAPAESDRAAFFSDEAGYALQWEDSRCRLYQKKTTGEDTALTLTYVPVDARYLGGQALTLKNNSLSDKTVCVYEALYSASGRMLEIKQTAEISIPAGGSTDTQLPTLSAGGQTVSAKLFVLEGDAPVSEAPVLRIAA